MVSVPLYDTLGPDAVEYICNHAELAAVGCSAAVLPTLLSCIARCPTVKLLVSCVGAHMDLYNGMVHRAGYEQAEQLLFQAERWVAANVGTGLACSHDTEQLANHQIVAYVCQLAS
jgi:long-subunit acyl-CoA synthetase (AMP-forming)